MAQYEVRRWNAVRNFKDLKLQSEETNIEPSYWLAGTGVPQTRLENDREIEGKRLLMDQESFRFLTFARQKDEMNNPWDG